MDTANPYAKICNKVEIENITGPFMEQIVCIVCIGYFTRNQYPADTDRVIGLEAPK